MMNSLLPPGVGTPVAEEPDTYRVAADELRSFVERIERLEAEKKDLADAIKEVFAESKGRGYDNKALREILKRRKRDRDELAEQDALLEMYAEALGMY